MVCLVGGGLPGPGRVLPDQRVCLVQGGFSLPGGSPCPGGFSLPGEPPPVDRITDTCKNITLATTSLRPVKIEEKIRNRLKTSVKKQICNLSLISKQIKGCTCYFPLHGAHSNVRLLLSYTYPDYCNTPTFCSLIFSLRIATLKTNWIPNRFVSNLV